MVSKATDSINLLIDVSVILKVGVVPEDDISAKMMIQFILPKNQLTVTLGLIESCTNKDANPLPLFVSDIFRNVAEIFWIFGDIFGNVASTLVILLANFTIW